MFENSQEGTYQKRFSKRKDKTIFELGDEDRFCSRFNLTDKDKRGRFIEGGKILVKVGLNQFWSESTREKQLKRTLRM